ncbi:MAG: metallophosphatase family protein [Dehalococcoidia bacterium]|nr:metallophosphatase family protein [Dehalococcoidia bacterium]
MELGLVADTHGYLGCDVLAALEGCDHILHAGDVGDGVLSALRGIAPVTAVRGNNDTSGEAAGLPEIATVDSPAGPIAVVHRLVDAPPEGWEIVVFGHCHRQHAYRGEDGRLFANPGAAGRRGFHRARSVARLRIEGGSASVEFVDLGLRKAAP